MKMSTSGRIFSSFVVHDTGMGVNLFMLPFSIHNDQWGEERTGIFFYLPPLPPACLATVLSSSLAWGLLTLFLTRISVGVADFL